MELIDLLNLPPEQIFRGFFLPFVILFAISWGVLTSLRIFDKRINLVISLALTVLVVFTPQFTIFATYLTQLGGQFAVAAFFIVFGFGVLMWAFGRGKDIYYEQISSKKEKMNKEIAKHYKKYKEAMEKDDKERMNVEMDIIKKLEMERDLAD